MGAKAELVSWAAFTVGLLAGTYLTTGSPLEYLVFMVYIALAALGLFKSSYFLALAWLIHPVWDFVPRTLPANLHDLPLACALFDIPIGLYLLWGSWKKRWQPISQSSSTRDALIKSAKAFFAGTVIIASSSAVAAAFGTEYLNWIALATAVVVIFSFRLIGHAGELVAWAVFTGWVGMTYAHTGGLADAIFFFVFVAVSAYGTFRSPYALGIAWLIFMLYSFLPHHSDHMPPDLPMATVFYCLPIGIYLVWAAHNNRWKSLASSPPKIESNESTISQH
jgi:hypothetical protein